MRPWSPCHAETDVCPTTRCPANADPQDACGVFGLWVPGEDVAKLACFGLYALQHRGQESAGIATSDGQRLLVCWDMGLVSQVFDERSLASLTRHIAVGHCRYSTTGGSTWENASRPSAGTPGFTVALAHNGNLTNSAELREIVMERAAQGFDVHAGELRRGNTTDTALVTALLVDDPAKTIEERPRGVAAAARRLQFRLHGRAHVVCRPRPQGIRPSSSGRLDRGWVVASETAALDIVGAAYVREVEPGDGRDRRERPALTRHWATPEPKGCVFEYVYLARPDTTINGRSRPRGAGRDGPDARAQNPVEPTSSSRPPRSGTPAAIGYAQESGIPYGQGLVKNAYVGRTFIQPNQTIRQLGIRLKLEPLKEVIKGQPATRRRRRLDRARQHPACPRPSCCVKPARPRSTSASPHHPSGGRASMASTSPPAPS